MGHEMKVQTLAPDFGLPGKSLLLTLGGLSSSARACAVLSKYHADVTGDGPPRKTNSPTRTPSTAGVA